MKSSKYVYLFEEADGTDKKLLGGKGAGLAEMTRMGLPVPPGFIVTTEACLHYYENKKRLPKGLLEEVEGKSENGGGKNRQKIWKCSKSPLLLCPVGRCDLHARNDGHHSQFGLKRQDP